MNKGATFKWDKSCHAAFEKIKKYLSNSSVLGAPTVGKPLTLCIAAQERSIGVLWVQTNEEGKEIVLYYLRDTLVGAELRYCLTKKICLSLIFAIQKLRHYMKSYIVLVISKDDPVKYILSRSILNGWLAKWVVILKQYDLVYVPQGKIEGQALADFLADRAIANNWKLNDNLLRDDVFFINILLPWEMHFEMVLVWE